MDHVAGATPYLVEELGDARLRCAELVRYIENVRQILGRLDRDDLDKVYELGGHLIDVIPETLFKLEKALQAVALSVNKIDTDELKKELAVPKVEQMERVLDEVRVHPFRRMSESDRFGEPESEAPDPEKLQQAVAAFKTLLGSSSLPEGPDAKRGLPLPDEGVYNYQSFAKPLSDHSTETESVSESIHRIDDAKSMTKVEPGATEHVDNSDTTPSYFGLGPSDDTKPKSPNRDDRGDIKMAVLEEWRARQAATVLDIQNGLNPDIVDRAKGCSVRLRRFEAAVPKWTFDVDAGNGPRIVVMRADQKNLTHLNKMAVKVACSCPAWRWWGPEFHATSENYQDPKTPLQGTASTPDIRDPERKNYCCKHVAAVLTQVQGWILAKKKDK